MTDLSDFLNWPKLLALRRICDTSQHVASIPIKLRRSVLYYSTRDNCCRALVAGMIDVQYEIRRKINRMSSFFISSIAKWVIEMIGNGRFWKNSMPLIGHLAIIWALLLADAKLRRRAADVNQKQRHKGFSRQKSKNMLLECDLPRRCHDTCLNIRRHVTLATRVT